MRSLLLVSLVAASAAAQQQLPTRTFAKPEVEFADPFTQITSVRELRDGRLIVSDSRDKTLQTVDFGAKKTGKVGHEGSGPQEYGMPGRLHPFAGDSTLLQDLLNSRFLLLAPDGSAVRTVSPTVGAGSSLPVAASGGTQFSFGGPGGVSLGARALVGARSVDARGRFYYTNISITVGANGMVRPDSIPLVRSDLAGARVDTVAWINQVKTPTSTTTNSSGGMSITRSVTPFQTADEWTVFPDGRVAIARAGNYRVDVVAADGKRGSGAPVQFTPVRVTEDEKEEWRAAQRASPPIVSSFGGGGGATQTMTMPVQEPASWPETKSPFPASTTASGSIWAAPNGETWVFRSRAAKDRVPVADVFSAQGSVIGRVQLPVGTRLVGFGPKSVYLVRIDDDDLQYLQRHAVQW